MDGYRIFKLKTGAIHLNTEIAEQIVMYCLGQMGNEELSFEKWKVGISESDGEVKNAKYWNCTNPESAADTKRYFIEQKIMEDANNGEVFNGSFIYVMR